MSGINVEHMRRGWNVDLTLHTWVRFLYQFGLIYTPNCHLRSTISFPLCPQLHLLERTYKLYYDRPSLVVRESDFQGAYPRVLVPFSDFQKPRSRPTRGTPPSVCVYATNKGNTKNQWSLLLHCSSSSPPMAASSPSSPLESAWQVIALLHVLFVFFLFPFVINHSVLCPRPYDPCLLPSWAIGFMPLMLWEYGRRTVFSCYEKTIHVAG